MLCWKPQKTDVLTNDDSFEAFEQSKKAAETKETATAKRKSVAQEKKNAAPLKKVAAANIMAKDWQWKLPRKRYKSHNQVPVVSPSDVKQSSAIAKNRQNLK